MQLPKRSEEHIIDEQALSIINSTLVTDWIVRSQEGRDYGIDLQLERYNSEKPTGDYIFSQVKGTKKEFGNKIKISNFPVKTINYALLFSVPFFVFYTSISSKKTSFVWLQKYVEFYLNKENPKWKEQKTITITFPTENDLDNNSQKIIDIVKRDKSIKFGHKFLTHYERFCNFYTEIKKGKTDSAKICQWQLAEIIKMGALTEYGIKGFIARTENEQNQEIGNFITVFDEIKKLNSISKDHLMLIDHIITLLSFGKAEFLNMDTFDNLANWLTGQHPY